MGVVDEVAPSPKAHNTEVTGKTEVEVLVRVIAPLQPPVLVKLIFMTELIVRFWLHWYQLVPSFE